MLGQKPAMDYLHPKGTHLILCVTYSQHAYPPFRLGFFIFHIISVDASTKNFGKVTVDTDFKRKSGEVTFWLNFCDDNP